MSRKLPQLGNYLPRSCKSTTRVSKSCSVVASNKTASRASWTASGAPVNKFRQGFFSKPASLTQQAEAPGQKKPKSNNKSAGEDGASEAIFRNVVHELQDRDLPVEMHYALTDDGYWIPVVRVPAKSKLKLRAEHVYNALQNACIAIKHPKSVALQAVITKQCMQSLICRIEH